MATTYGDIYNRFRYSIDDYESPYTVDLSDTLSLILSLANGGIALINRKAPFIEATGAIKPDGTNFLFNLTTEGSEISELLPEAGTGTALTNFLKMRLATIIGASGKRITRHPRGFTYIRDMGACDGILAGEPSHYAIRGRKIAFDAIQAAPANPSSPTAAELFTVDYWSTPTALAQNSDEPNYPLNSGWDELIQAAMKMSAGPYVRGEIGEIIKAEGNLDFYGIPGKKGMIDEFREFVRTLGILDESDGIPYSDLGGDPAVSIEPSDYRSTNPWAGLDT